jgi:predicted acylesterase/phospholipase RssA
MINDFDFKIGLAFSGGGYRASSFSLGVLTYLNVVKFDNNHSLLEKVIALSTVSGGTIAGASYALGIKQNESLDEIYKRLYTFMTEVDLINMSLDHLGAKYKWESQRNHNLINAFADIYHHKLFNHAKFGVLLDNNHHIHLKHISFNATEFSNALQFRFQVSEKLNNPKPREPERGVIGNFYYKIHPDDAREIRMADILAASSCFPGGFEPIMFPDDFEIHISKPTKSQSENRELPVGLMDGGIVDNQGIEPLILADKRMKRNKYPDGSIDNTPPEFDLLIISDVASPYMDKYVASEEKESKGFGKLTLRTLFCIDVVLLVLALITLVFSVKYQWMALLILSTAITTIAGIAFILALTMRALPVKFHVPDLFLKPLRKLLKIRVSTYDNLFANRINSMLKLTGTVFLKHIRRLNYNTIFDDSYWKNRRVMTAVYELRAGEDWKGKIKKGTLPEYLKPSTKIQNAAKDAASMPTTLWFTGTLEEKKNTLDTLIATGQFTTCWNLLEYIYNLNMDSSNTNQGHAEFKKLEGLLLEHWEKFQIDPYWLVKEINSVCP